MGKVIAKSVLTSWARSEGFKGSTLEEFKSFLDDQGIDTDNFKHGGKSVDIDRSWKSTKAVEIRATEGEQIIDMTEGDTASGDEEIDEEKMEDEDEAEAKSHRPATKRPTLKSYREIMNGKRVEAPSVHGEGSFAAQRKAYNRKANRGGTVYSDADTAEVVGACFRLSAMGGEHGKRYEQRDNDLSIVQKAGATYDDSLGGITVPDSFSSELIELKTEYGAARQVAGVYTMDQPKENVPRLVDDVTMTYVGENQDSDTTDFGFDGVDLIAHEISGINYQSIRLLRHSAVNIADLLSRSFARATGLKEDTAYFLGDAKQQGIANKIGANSTYTIASTSSFIDSAISVSEIQGFLGKLPKWVRSGFRSEVVVTCAESVYDQIFGRFEANAPGNTKENLRTENGARWGGYNFIFNNVMADTWSNGVTAAYVGAFRPATKFGEVAGSNMMRSSEHVAFVKRQMAWQASEEFAVNPHDVNNTAESGVIALKLTS